MAEGATVALASSAKQNSPLACCQAPEFPRSLQPEDGGLSYAGEGLNVAAVRGATGPQTSRTFEGKLASRHKSAKPRLLDWLSIAKLVASGLGEIRRTLSRSGKLARFRGAGIQDELVDRKGGNSRPPRATRRLGLRGLSLLLSFAAFGV